MIPGPHLTTPGMPGTPAGAPRAVADPPAAQWLADVRAKSRPKDDPERLTTHSRAVLRTAWQVRERIADAGLLRTAPGFWPQVLHAALLHDAGKVAEGFQLQIRPGGRVWGERHEVLSLAYVDLLGATADWNETDRLMIATLVATHHRALYDSSSGGSESRPSLSRLYTEHTDWAEAFTLTPGPGGPVVQVPRGRHRELLRWLTDALTRRRTPPPPDGTTLAERSRRLLTEVLDAWRAPADPDTGLLAVLAQGALTLADHAGSAHVTLQTHLPLPADYLQRLPYPPYPHQSRAARAAGHLVLIAPTGSGKTEAGLGWAAAQLATMPGLPRVVWTLPYRASLNAARTRFEEDLRPPPGAGKPDIGLLHGTVAHTLLTQAVEDGCPDGGPGPTATMARQAAARAAAMRLFTQRMRVATPHQLLSGAIAGPAYSSVLLEQANSLFVLDELHAYEPETFGQLCAAMTLWERLGSRVAVLSATLAPPMTSLIADSLTGEPAVERAADGTGPVRHRLTLDEESLTSPGGCERLRAWLAEGHSVLAVVNRVAVAQELFAELAEDARAARPGDEHAALLLHSRFKNRDRDRIERRLLARHPERRPDETEPRGGLVVATQTVEVSLRLDFDRGAVECAPVEAVAQRAGRVNRRGRHPEGAVEFRVHRAESPRPYETEAVDAAWTALTTLAADGTTTLGEQDIDRLLELSYDTEWGRRWAETARRARDAFAETFLTFSDPFHDRSEFARLLTEQFDSVEVLHRDDVAEYRDLTRSGDGHPLLATGLLIPLRVGQLPTYRAEYDRTLGVHVIEGEYNTTVGLRPLPESETEPETIL